MFGRLPWFAPPFFAVAALACPPWTWSPPSPLVPGPSVTEQPCLAAPAPRQLRSRSRTWLDGRGWRQEGRTRVHAERAARRAHPTCRGDAVEHLQRVVAEWQLLADMSFADFLLWVPLSCRRAARTLTRCAPSAEWLCVAQARPTTAPTAHPEDAVGSAVTRSANPQLRRAVVEGRICREEDPRWHLEVPVRSGDDPRAPRQRGAWRCSPATRTSPCPACPARWRSPTSAAPPTSARWSPTARSRPVRPSPGADTQPARRRRPDPARRARPRRLRQPERALGLPPDGPRQRPRRAVAGRPRPARWCATRSTPPRSPPGSTARSTGGTRCAWRSRPRGASMLVRALPLRPRGDAAGALVLVRDVTDLRRRDQALLSARTPRSARSTTG